MPFRRRRRMMASRPIVQSIKNQFASKQSLVPATATSIQYAVTVPVGAPTKLLGTEVPAGAKVYSVQCFINVINPTGTGDGNLDYFFAKARSGQTLNNDFPDPDFTDIGLSDVRNQIFKSSSKLFGSEDAGPLQHQFRLKIPKIYQRMRDGDILFLKIEASIACEISIGFIYKYYQ